MKWAESLVIDTCLLGRYIPIDDIEYLDARFDVLGERQINEELKIKHEELESDYSKPLLVFSL